MSVNDTFNRGGMTIFVVAFVGIMIFFCVVLAVNPGPLDTGGVAVQVRFSKTENDARLTAWKQPTPENIAYGRDVYPVNCAICHAQSGTDEILERFEKNQTKHGSKPLEIYAFIRKGEKHRFDYVPEKEKWALIAFMRSKMTNPPEDSESEWQSYLKQGRY